MLRLRTKLALVAICGGLLCGVTGGCLPANLFADLAGGVIETTVNTVLGEILDALFNQAAAA